MAQQNKRKTGADHEAEAADYLRDQGYRILEMNYRNRYGEIDIVAQEGRYLVFCEVKYRSGYGSGSAEAAVTLRKQKQISRIALFYLAHKKLTDSTPVRFDVAAVTPEGVRLYRNAFDYLA